MTVLIGHAGFYWLGWGGPGLNRLRENSEFVAKSKENRPQGLKRLRKNGAVQRGNSSWPLQGLKPDVDLIGLIGPTEVVPFYKAFQIRRLIEFFRSL
jgi:hypothetical protein